MCDVWWNSLTKDFFSDTGNYAPFDAPIFWRWKYSRYPLIYACDMTHLYAWRVIQFSGARFYFPLTLATTSQSSGDESTPDTHSFTRVTWLIYICQVCWNSLTQDFFFSWHRQLRTIFWRRKHSRYSHLMRQLPRLRAVRLRVFAMY